MMNEQRVAMKVMTRRSRGIRILLAIGAALSFGSLVSGSDEGAGAESTPGSIRFVGKNLVATANGVFHTWRFTSSEIDFDRLGESEVVVEVDLASVDTESRRRDDHLRTADFFDVETYPTATVRVHGARQDGTDADGNPRYRADFEIDLHGVKKTIEGEFEISSQEPRTVTGRLTMDRRDFGVGKPHSRWNPMSIGNVIPVEFSASLAGG